MGLFKSAEEKRIEEKMLIKKAMSKIKRYIEQLNTAKTRYKEEAIKAKKQGIASQYKLAISGLKMATRQSQVAEQLLLNLELNQQTKDASEVTRDFVSGMSTLGKEINELNGKINVARTSKKMRTAMAQSERMREGLEGFMDESEMLFGSMSDDAGTDAEFDALIMRDMEADTADLSEMDAEIDKLLKRAGN